VVRFGDRVVSLTSTEFDVLALLAQNADRVVPRTRITRRLRRRAGQGTETLRVHVSHLRRTIESPSLHRQVILAEPGAGHRFAALG
jgi:DNA-binding response OmpR family regulator